MSAKRWPVIVIGGGLAGAACAAHLAAAGIRTLLLEKQAEPHDKVCGEFISVEACAALDQLGISLYDCPEIHKVMLTQGQAQIDSPLPFTARSLTRRALDGMVLRKAAANGATVRTGVTVTALDRQQDGWLIKANDGMYLAKTVMLATGKHDLRGHHRAAGVQNNLIGFKILLQLPQASLQGTTSLHLFKGGYAGLQPVENGCFNLCLLVSKRQYAACGKSWSDLLRHLSADAPRLRALLQGARFLWEKPLAIASLPYGFIHKQNPAEPALYRLGDQMAVIPSFSGDGMAIALHSARQAASFYLAGRGSRAYHYAMCRLFSRQVRLAIWLSLLAVRPWGQHLIVMAAGRWPALLPRIAAATRIRAS